MEIETKVRTNFNALDITMLAHKLDRGNKPTYHCDNCKCDRYRHCTCMLGGEARRVGLKRIRSQK